MKAQDKLKEISRKLGNCGIEAAEKEAELLLSEGINMSRIDMYKDNPELNNTQTQSLDKMISRRCSREPLQYIIGHIDFLGLNLEVGKGVLIPRPETELMAEHAIKLLGARNTEQKSVLDLCTGSGCVALAIAVKFPDALVYGVDISEKAIRYARINAERNNVKNAFFYCGDLFSTVNKTKSFDLIISNPPYIKSDDIKDLQPEIRDWEPLNALDGGRDGLVYYREIVPAARQILNDTGILMFELGDGYAQSLKKMFENSGYSSIEILKDYSGKERIILSKKNQINGI
jgi:release factor glutamine methyltransferase